MKIHKDLKLRAYELLVADLYKELEELHEEYEEYSGKNIDRTEQFCNFIYRELGYKKLMELAKIIDESENNNEDMTCYVECFYTRG